MPTWTWTTTFSSTTTTHSYISWGNSSTSNNCVVVYNRGGRVGDGRDEVMRQNVLAVENTQRDQRSAADMRANALLLSVLNDAQREQYEQHRVIDLIGSHGGHYRIHTEGTPVGNVAWLDDAGVEGGRLCAHPSLAGEWLPLADILLGQLLHLMTDEPDFVRIANLYNGRPHPRVRRQQPMVVAS